jgi:hypothetical protein
MQRRNFLTAMIGSAASLTIWPVRAQLSPNDVAFERPVTGTPHKGCTGYMIRATSGDLGDDVGQPGIIGENIWHDEENPDHYVYSRCVKAQAARRKPYYVAASRNHSRSGHQRRGAGEVRC